MLRSVMTVIVDISQALALLAAEIYLLHDPLDSSVPLQGERLVRLIVQVLPLVLVTCHCVTMPGVTEQVHNTVTPDESGRLKS